MLLPTPISVSWRLCPRLQCVCFLVIVSSLSVCKKVQCCPRSSSDRSDRPVSALLVIWSNRLTMLPNSCLCLLRDASVSQFSDLSRHALEHVLRGPHQDGISSGQHGLSFQSLLCVDAMHHGKAPLTTFLATWIASRWSIFLDFSSATEQSPRSHSQRKLQRRIGRRRREKGGWSRDVRHFELEFSPSSIPSPALDLESHGVSLVWLWNYVTHLKSSESLWTLRTTVVSFGVKTTKSPVLGTIPTNTPN